MANDFVIETDGLTKQYRGRTAVDQLSFSVPVGVVAGFVGPNGAGKTTTMSMLLGLVGPTGGTARVLGEPIESPDAYLRQVGALIERPAFYGGLSGAENLEVLATVAGHSTAEIPALLDLAGLGDRGGDRFASYSMGMKQRLGIAAALLGEPALLILDEPTNGLDPAGIHEMRNLIARLADGGRTVFVSSHVLAELEQVCDYLVVIDYGSLLFQGTTKQLLAGSFSGLAVAPEHPSDLGKLQVLLDSRGLPVRNAEGRLVVGTNGSDARAVAADVNRIAASEGFVLVELTQEKTTLEDRYLEMVSGGDR